MGTGSMSRSSASITSDLVCDPTEDCLWCADCCDECTLGQGTAYEYIVTQILVSTNATEARMLGVDVDGDGEIDNKAGQLASFIPFERPFNEMVEDNIQDGRFILLARIYADQFPDDDSVSVQVLAGDTDPSHDATEDNLTGIYHFMRGAGLRRVALLPYNPSAGAKYAWLDRPYELQGEPQDPSHLEYLADLGRNDGLEVAVD